MTTPTPSGTFARRVLDAASRLAAFPLGGIGTGNVSVGARGELRDWELSNRPDKGTWLPFTFFAIRAEPEGHGAVTRVLEACMRGPHEGDSGYHIGKVAGLPRLAGSRMRGEYPLLTIDFDDDALPIDVRLTAFTPLVPLDADASGIPGAVLRYTVTNPSPRPVEVSIAASMSNPIAITGRNVFQFPEHEGIPTLEYRDDGALRGLAFGTDLPADHPLYGTAALTSSDEAVTAMPLWPVDFWQDGAQLFWDEFSRNGRLRPADRFSYEDDADPARLPRLRVGSIAVTHTIAPGESRDVEFVLAWHVPNRRRAWNGMVGLPNTNADEIVRNHYATRFVDAWQVAEHLTAGMPQLETATRTFHRTLHASTLPAEVIDAVSATLVVARSTTCFRLDDGTPEGQFAAWEGSFDHAGSCEGTCTHVWNYAQTLAHLFPALERSARRNEFLNETLPDGRMRFRSNAVFGAEPLEFHPAVDGQMGTVVRLYREWRNCGDDAFLTELWPSARRALEYAFTAWDSDGDGVLDSKQHNTYDIEFYGENSLANSMFFAALRAGAAMAEHLGDDATAERYRECARDGSARMDALLFNGEYYDQRLDDVDARRYQYGTGCLSDQLFGQTLAHLTGLGHVLPVAHVKSAIEAVYRHNFRTDLVDHASVQRAYALDDESGLVLCSWPNGGRPRIPFVYSDEVWSGIEYQVATHLIYEGFVAEGLRIVRGVRERHDGVRRNPWNEAECGNHYARSMASWGVLQALTGADWDGVGKRLRLAPHAEAFACGTARFFFATGTGWGEAVFDAGEVTVTVLGGSIAADGVSATHPTAGEAESGPIAASAGETIRLTGIPTTTVPVSNTQEKQ